MSETCRQVIYDALRKIQVTAAGETPSAEEGSDGLRTLNNMMAGLALEAIDVDWRTLTLDDPFPLPDKFLNAVIHLLAVDLSPEYGREVDPVVAVKAERSRALLQGAYNKIPVTQFEKALTQRVGTLGTYDITSDQ